MLKLCCECFVGIEFKYLMNGKGYNNIIVNKVLNFVRIDDKRD